MNLLYVLQTIYHIFQVLKTFAELLFLIIGVGLQVCVILPSQLPVTTDNLNWTPITVGIALSVIFAAWYLPFWGARNWYSGTRRTQRRVAPPPPPERDESEDLDSAGSSRMRSTEKVCPHHLPDSQRMCRTPMALERRTNASQPFVLNDSCSDQCLL